MYTTINDPKLFSDMLNKADFFKPFNRTNPMIKAISLTSDVTKTYASQDTAYLNIMFTNLE